MRLVSAVLLLALLLVGAAWWLLDVSGGGGAAVPDQEPDGRTSQGHAAANRSGRAVATVPFAGAPEVAPALAQEQVTEPVRVRLRVLGAAGEPWRKRRFRVRWVRRGEATREWQEELARQVCTTDADGWIGLPAPPRRADHLVVAWQVPFPPEPHERWRRYVPIGASRGPGIRRLPDVTLPALPLLVSGRVVDAEGRGVPRALVHLASSADALPGRRERPWYSELACARCDDSGAFAIHTVSEAPGLRLHAQLGVGGTSRLVPFTAGDTGVQLTLQQPGSLGLLLEAAHEDLVRLLQLSLSSASPGTPGRLEPALGDGGWGNETLLDPGAYVRRSMPVLRVAAGRRFVIDFLGPGTYRLELRVGRIRSLAVENIVIEPGEECRDPRLQGVVVGSHLMAARVRVRDPSGRPVAGARVQLLRAPSEHGSLLEGESHHLWLSSDREGWVGTVMSRGARVHVRVDAPGWLPWVRKNAVFPLEVSLSAGCVVRARLVVNGTLPREEGTSYQLMARPRGARVLQQDGEGLFRHTAAYAVTCNLQDGRSVGTLKGLAPGNWEVLLVATRFVSPAATSGGGGGGSSGEVIPTPPPPPIARPIGAFTVRPADRELDLAFRVEASGFQRR